jgi:hypothetical protein
VQVVLVLNGRGRSEKLFEFLFVDVGILFAANAGEVLLDFTIDFVAFGLFIEAGAGLRRGARLPCGCIRRVPTARALRTGTPPGRS